MRFSIQLPNRTVGLRRPGVAKIEHAGGFALTRQAAHQAPVLVGPVGRQHDAVLGRRVGQGVAFLDTHQRIAADAQPRQLRRCATGLGDFGVVVGVSAGYAPHAVEQRLVVVEHQLGTVGAGVGGVGEEAHVMHARHTKVVVDVLLQRVTANPLRQGDAVFDGDVEHVQRRIKAVVELCSQAEAEVFRGFRVELLGTQGAGDRAVDRQRADVGQHAVVTVVGGGVLEPDLCQRRRAEVVRHRTSQGQLLSQAVAPAELAGEFAARVVVMLKACGHVDKQTVGEVARQLGVRTEHIAVQVHLFARAQAVGAVGTVAEVRGLVTGKRQVVFVTVFSAHGQHERAIGKAHLATQVQVGGGLAELIVAGVKAGWRISSEAGVEGALG